MSPASLVPGGTRRCSRCCAEDLSTSSQRGSNCSPHPSMPELRDLRHRGVVPWPRAHKGLPDRNTRAAVGKQDSRRRRSCSSPCAQLAAPQAQQLASRQQSVQQCYAAYHHPQLCPSPGAEHGDTGVTHLQNREETGRGTGKKVHYHLRQHRTARRYLGVQGGHQRCQSGSERPGSTWGRRQSVSCHSTARSPSAAQEGAQSSTAARRRAGAAVRGCATA